MDYKATLQKSNPRVTEITAGLEEVEEALEASHEAQAAGSVKRRELLVRGTDDEVAALDQNMAGERLQHERLMAAQETLAAMLPEAKAREAEARRKAAQAQVEQAQRDGLQALEDYDQSAQATAEALERLQKARTTIRELSRMGGVGVLVPEAAYRDRRFGKLSSGYAQAPLETVKLPVAMHPTFSYWPPNLPHGSV